VKDREWQWEEHEKTTRQKRQHGEINVAEWNTKEKTSTDHFDAHSYFTNLMAEYILHATPGF
jgi:hypothetical protein